MDRLSVISSFAVRAISLVISIIQSKRVPCLREGREEGIVKDGPRICCGTLLPLHVVVLLGNPLKFAAFSRCRRRPFRLHRIFEPMKAWPVKWRLC